MSSALYQSIEALSREKSIDPGIVVSAVEEAIALATRKYYKTQENMRGELNKDTGEIAVYAYKTVMGDEEEIEDPVNQITLDEAHTMAAGAELEPGSEIRLYKDTRPLGRIAAQLAKQVIFQKVREAERDTVFNEYAHREKEVLSAAVKRIEGQDIIIDLGKAEARMPKREQSRLEQFSVGERIRVVLLKVDRAAKGPQVVVSRAAPELVSNLFQSEVPEIYDNTVVIRAIAREAGERTKIAVMSRDKDVDPVGACVGMKGMRVQSIIRELRGEKIDIIEYNEEITTFAEKALQPAKVSRVSIVDIADKQLEVIVEATKSLKVVPTDIQHGPEVLQRFKVAHKPLVKALSSFESMESHGEPIKPLLRQLITWTPPKEGITLLELFGGIGTGLEALLQSGMVVWRYFYVDIDPIARQVAASRMREFTTRFPQQFTATAWKASFTFLPSDIQLIQKKHMELLGPVDLIISGWECQGFSAAGFGEGLSDTRSSLFTDMVRLITWAQSISPTFGYVIENTPSQLDQREKVQEHYTLVKHYLGEPLLLDAAQCDSYAHRLCNWWTNLAPLSVLQLTLKYTIKDPNLQVSHILDDQSSCQPVTR